jgi:S-adenosylmethionine decarboxylase proenzyme
VLGTPGVETSPYQRFPDNLLGRHFLFELYDCRCLPTEAADLQRHMERAATLIGATIVCSQFHAFSPHGLSGVVVIAESHLAIHTWPEFQCACVDLFTCSAAMVPEPGLEYLRHTFAAGRVELLEVPRGANAVEVRAARPVGSARS